MFFAIQKETSQAKVSLMKNIFCRLIVAFLVFIPLTAVALEPDSEKALVKPKKTVRPVSAEAEYLGLGIPFLQNASEDLSMEIKALADALVVVRQRQADQGADITEINDLVKTWSGKMENLLKSLSVAERRLNQLNARMTRMERSLNALQGERRSAKPDSAEKSKNEGPFDPDAAYETALRYFKEENYDQARSEFQRIVEELPGSQKAALAHFWIGECFYNDGNYEQAILEYEKVIKHDPKGEKASQALLKEGLSFSKLGDNATAKLVLQQLVDQYPDSTEAVTASAKLAEMK